MRARVFDRTFPRLNRAQMTLHISHRIMFCLVVFLFFLFANYCSQRKLEILFACKVALSIKTGVKEPIGDMHRSYLSPSLQYNIYI